MKKQSLHIVLAAVMALSLLLASCGKKMDPLKANLFSVNPSPLELVGTKVPVTIDGRIPQGWFDKNTTIVITPVLVHGAGEALGTPQTYQGENVLGNGIEINQKNGGNITLRSSFDYEPSMKQSELFLRFQVSKKGKEIKGFPDLKVADGVIATAALASATTTTPSVAPDAFQRIIKETHDADILFLIQQATLRQSELNSTNMQAWKDLVQEADRNDRKKLDVEISAYASPDGGYKLNEALAEKRESNTNEYLKKEFKKADIDTEINARYTAQDWEGFQKLVQASNLQDKDLVLRVLSMYSDPETREREIKNISVVYSELAETILPQLRRSRLIANVEIIGKTDQEIKDAVNAGMNDLSLEELLYATTLGNDMPKQKILEQASRKYTNDYRAWNNLGVLAFQNGDFAKASEMFNKAKGLSSDAKEAVSNLGLLALKDGDLSKAEQLLGTASGAASLNEALGLLYIKKGEYGKAVQQFAGVKSNNAALAQLLSKNYSEAQRTVNAIENKDATSYYIGAVVAARTNDMKGIVDNLKNAMKNGISLSSISLDNEFAKFLSNEEFMRQLSR